jgi:hypothetical protein
VAKGVAAPPPAAGPAGESAAVLEKAMADPGVTSLMQKANDYEREANGLLDKPFVEGASERASQLRGLAANYRQLAIQMRDKIAEPELAALKEKTAADVRSRYETVETQPTPGQPSRIVRKSDILSGDIPENAPVGKQPAAIEKQQEGLAAYKQQQSDAAVARQQVRSNLNALKQVLESYEPGRFAEQKAALVGALKSAGFNVDLGVTADPAKFEEFVKNAMGTVVQQAAAAGDTRLRSEFESILKANANPTLQPEANRAIIGKTLGLLDWEDKHFNDLTDWSEKNPYAYDRTKFERDWIKANPTEKYIKEATAAVPVRGAPVPPVKDRVAGKTKHVNAQGEMFVWNGHGWDHAGGQ